MDIFSLVKPLLAVQGIRGIQVKFDTERRGIQVTGQQHRKDFELFLSFDQVESQVNGPGVTPGGNNSGDRGPNPGPGGHRPT